MSLYCSCPEWDGGPGSWVYYSPHDFTKLKTKRRKRCSSCEELIDIGADCLKFQRNRAPYTEIERDIKGDEIEIAPLYMCEACGEIYLNLEDIGYCLNPCDDMEACLKYYHELTGFVTNRAT